MLYACTAAPSCSSPRAPALNPLWPIPLVMLVLLLGVLHGWLVSDWLSFQAWIATHKKA